VVKHKGYYPLKMPPGRFTAPAILALTASFGLFPGIFYCYSQTLPWRWSHNRFFRRNEMEP